VTTLSLFDWRPPVASPTAPEQSHHLARVESNQGAFILAWCALRVDCGHPTFRLCDLEDAVRANAGGTPGSASRVLRDLRSHGFLAYDVERGASRYTLTMVRP